MKPITFILLALFSNSLHAQPGPMYRTENLNFNDFVYDSTIVNNYPSRIFSPPIYSPNQFIVYRNYYIDSTTDLSRLTLLFNSAQIKQITINLNYIPSELILNGRYLTHIIFENPNAKSYSHANQDGVRNSVLTDLNQLNHFSNLSNVAIHGYTIRVPPDTVLAKTKRQSTANLTFRFYNCAVESVGYNEELSVLQFTNSSFKKLKLDKVSPKLASVQIMNHLDSSIDLTLPDRLVSFYINSSPMLQEIQFTPVSTARFQLMNCMNLKKVTGSITRSRIEDVHFNASLEVLPDLFKIIQSAHQIDDFSIIVPEGIAEIKFLNDNLLIFNFDLKGGNYGKTKFKFSSFSHIDFKTFNFYGDLYNLPKLSKIKSLENCNINYSVDFPEVPAERLLKELKNLKEVTITGAAFKLIPNSFFRNNPQLLNLYINKTSITEITFGQFEMISLHRLYLRDNRLIHTVPERKYYPNAQLSISNSKL